MPCPLGFVRSASSRLCNLCSIHWSPPSSWRSRPLGVCVCYHCVGSCHVGVCCIGKKDVFGYIHTHRQFQADDCLCRVDHFLPPPPPPSLPPLSLSLSLSTWMLISVGAVTSTQGYWQMWSCVQSMYWRGLWSGARNQL